ncbi:uncharacterized protein BO97DRAFT_144084 [Aspergillus homomorphus CBS 101889]|uniref:Uncharacterized protein n=1 Tax=Aspergillus homomorphus (strain CBS 101889) TaxID=1450537 RepID=A0A395HRK0_ASPHC|nr:hypothetical protein BO97DRAFT_144084 [Aspergillus homomorphus CBS 101889]RAL10196.1 hypothetical protein BO97DRAFT_144084 [Aspergillus homomorphus CBS 101889]
MSAETPQHFERRKYLGELEHKVEALQIHTLNLSQLNELGIDLQPMSLKGTSGRKPFFFESHSGLPDPDEEEVHDTQSKLDDEDTASRVPSTVEGSPKLLGLTMPFFQSIMRTGRLGLGKSRVTTSLTRVCTTRVGHTILAFTI